MVNKGSYTGLFEGLELAVPRLGNVQLRFHFLRRGTSRGKYSNINTLSFTLPAANFQNGVYIISILDSQGKPYTTKIQR